ncbi:MAG: hypothetical protein ABJE47_07540 [bacterium]
MQRLNAVEQEHIVGGDGGDMACAFAIGVGICFGLIGGIAAGIACIVVNPSTAS